MDQLQVPAEAVIAELKARIAEDAVTIAMLRAHIANAPTGAASPR